MASLQLLGLQSRVEVPFIKVKIGRYTFGAYQETNLAKGVKTDLGVYRQLGIEFPNFVQSLEVKKINGQYNRYSLVMVYQITQHNDPNFLVKVFSSVSDTRAIEFSYGDMSTPSFTYRTEKAMILDVRQELSMESATITYRVTAASTGVLATVGSFPFEAKTMKPSDRIKEILYSPLYNLLEVFPGMRDRRLVEMLGLIDGTDIVENIEPKPSMPILDYLTFLVSCMRPSASSKAGLYTIVIVDSVTDEPSGTYFKVIRVDKENEDTGVAYSLDIGVPTGNVVTAFHVDDNKAFSIFYDYAKQLSSFDYVKRIDENGKLIDVYGPLLSSGNSTFKTPPSVASWWKSVTEYPIKASVTIRGLLRPATLMSQVRLRLYYFGRKYIYSGLYVVTSQTDRIDASGFSTTLGLTRIGQDASADGVEAAVLID